MLDDLAGIHDIDAVADVPDDREVVRDQDQRRLDARPQVGQELEDLMLHRGVERRGRLVRDDQARLADQRRRDHGALLHAAAQFVRIARGDARRFRDLHVAQRLDHAFAGLWVFRPALADRLGDLFADRHDRIEIAAGVLEDHRDVGRPHRLHVALVERPAGSRPSSSIEPPTIRPGGGTSRTIESAVIDLPEPDSPTMPIASPCPT